MTDKKPSLEFSYIYLLTHKLLIMKTFAITFCIIVGSLLTTQVQAQIVKKKDVMVFNFASSQSSTTLIRADLKKIVKFTFNNFAIRSYKLSFMDAVNKTLFSKTVSGDGNLFYSDQAVIALLPNIPAQGKIYFDDIKYVDANNQAQTSSGVVILAD